MIKFEHTSVMNMENAIRGMRNPLNSWDRSDSGTEYYETDSVVNGCTVCLPEFLLGRNDLDLAKRLVKAGSDHRKFLRQIFVSVDITAPLYWWKEFDTYKVSTVSNSCSTMHKIHSSELSMSDFSTDKLTADSEDKLHDLIEQINANIRLYNLCKLEIYWYQIIQLLPSSYNQRRTITMNYETLRNIYGSRKDHKLDEWRVGFINWIKTLPYADELIIN